MGRRNYSSNNKFTEADILREFEANSPSKTVFGNFRIEENQLVYRAQASEEIRAIWHNADQFKDEVKKIGKRIAELDGKLVDETGKAVLLEALTIASRRLFKCRIQYYHYNLIALKQVIGGSVVYFGNMETLPLVGRTVSYGHVSENNNETDIQKEMKRRSYTMLPLSQFEDADFTTYKDLQKKSAHLFEIEGQCYLHDMDQREVKYNRKRRFIVTLPKMVTAIDEAYQSLKPSEVVDAELSGKRVERIGRAFLIETDAPDIPKLDLASVTLVLAETSRLDNQIIKRLTGLDLVGDSYSYFNNPDVKSILEKVPQTMQFTVGHQIEVETAITLNDVHYCTGYVHAEGREELILRKWYKLVEALGEVIV
jgi:hypothetical protein